MCGIFAYLNYEVPKSRSEICELLFNGLRRLEYRGYDSAGVGVDSDVAQDADVATSAADATSARSSLLECLAEPPAAAAPLIVREQGKIDALVQKFHEDTKASGISLSKSFTSHVGIAHTRWATHGAPSPANAHPQSSGANNEFVVVHNGIITNYQVLKAMLQRHGFQFESETDTEVIPKLAKFVFDKLVEGVHASPRQSDGQGAASGGEKFFDSSLQSGLGDSNAGDEHFATFAAGQGTKVNGQADGARVNGHANGHVANRFDSSDAANLVRDGAITFPQVVVEVMRQLEGAYALLFKSPHFPNQLVACKRGSPLLLGIKDTANGRDSKASSLDSSLWQTSSSSSSSSGGSGVGGSGGGGGGGGGSSREGAERSPREYFLASDASAVVEHTKKVIVIEDNEVVHVKDGFVSLFFFDPDSSRGSPSLSRSYQRAISTLKMEVEQIMKGSYEHFMQKEIHEQPESLTTTMRGRLVKGGGKLGTPHGVLLGGLKDHLQTIRRSRRIIFIGCGSSYHAALASRPIVEELSGVPVQLELSSDLIDRKAPIYREDTAVFLSQSGETADTLQALDYARQRGALCVGITNTVGSAIARGTHCGVHINAGCEIGVASTKAYTSQIAVITLFALALGEDSISTQQRREAIINGLKDLPGHAKEVLSLDSEMKSLAEELVSEHSLLVFGRGFNFATALEAALKVKEVALMHSEGILAGEMKHGPLALVDETLPIIVVATHDNTFSKQQSVIQQLHARKGRLIVMCSKGRAENMCPNGAFRVIEVPSVEDCLQPIINIIPLQLLAYHLTVLRGFNVDQPRNLAKSVTVE